MHGVEFKTGSRRKIEFALYSEKKLFLFLLFPPERAKIVVERIKSVLFKFAERFGKAVARIHARSELKIVHKIIPLKPVCLIYDNYTPSAPFRQARIGDKKVIFEVVG